MHTEGMQMRWVYELSSTTGNKERRKSPPPRVKATLDQILLFRKQGIHYSGKF